MFTKVKIRVAIVGGGIAGATLLHALLPLEHVQVHIYESAPAFREAGMAIGIARNAFQALELISPSARGALEKAGSIPHHGVKFMLANGPDAGKMVDEIDARKDGKRLTSVVHRADFLSELLANVPAEIMHANKKLECVDETEEGFVILKFADGESREYDILVGADGIHSSVRKIILESEDKAASPVSAGWFHMMTIQPYGKMKEILGEEYVDLQDSREWAWFGDGTFMM